jgi:glutamate/tyrosine decarboxylase-like PLP-dependent enzyme
LAATNSVSLERLSVLEKSSRQLDPSPQEFSAWLQQIAQFADRYLSTLDDTSAIATSNSAPVRERFQENGQSIADCLSFLQRHILSSGVNTASGRFLGYIPGGGIPTAAIGDFLAALTNRYAGIYGASPGAGEIENQCIRWMCELVGYDSSAWGTLQSGGTLATLTALVAARETRSPAQWASGVIYSTAETHHSFRKCLKIVGLESTKHCSIATDDRCRMNVDDLRQNIAADRAAGLQPWILCATAGTTNSGAVDPLDEALTVARSEGMWAHVDAAYGGFFLLTDHGQKLLRGINQADSIVLDPHKGLFLPYGCGAVLVKRATLLRSAFASPADYLADVEKQGGISSSDYSPEGTRHFRGLRLWLSLAVNGLVNYRAALEEKLLLASYAHEQLKTIDGIQVGAQPELSCVVFCSAAGNAATQKLLERIISRGNTYVSSTFIAQSMAIRFCVLSFRTHRSHIDQAIADVRDCLEVL